MVTSPLRKRVRHIAAEIGILSPAFATYRVLREWRPALVMRNARLRLGGAPDGLPIPPGRLIFSAGASLDIKWFFEGGRDAADSLGDALSSVGRPLESFETILDFGCGCGRVLRHLVGRTSARLHGSDVNAAAVAWVQQNLPGVDARVSALQPPLSYEAGKFDLAYALSVFTHLPEELQEAWFTELHRVLRPGGLLLFSARGARYLASLGDDERERYEREGFVVRDGAHAGSNICGTWHAESWVRRRLADRFRLLHFIPDGARGNLQDLYVLERLGA